MKRRLFLIVAVLALFRLVPAGAQTPGEPFGVYKADIDALIRFIRTEVSPDVYFVRDTSDHKSYTIRVPKEEFLKQAFAELRSNGYTVTEYDGKYFLIRGTDLATTLPAGYFNTRQETATDSAFQKYLAGEAAIMTYQNKVYEIGDPETARKSGKATVRGYIRDVMSGEPLEGVTVYLEDGKTFAQSDAYGFYKIAMPVGTGQLCFSGYSLEDLKLNLVVYNDGSFDVVMKEKVFSLKGAVVTSESMSQHRTPQMGIEKVRINMIKNVPVVFGEADALKVVMTLPGIKSVGEASSGFNVRGGATDQNLILFNGGTIYNPNHMFGILSAFNPDVINDVELYKSSIPASYGGRISSVLEVRSRDGNSKKVQGSLGIGLLTSRLHIEGPLVKDRTTFILGGRTTYSNWMLNLLPENSSYTGGKASFQDVNLGLSHKVNERNSIHAYGYFSRDKFSFSNDTTFRYRNISGSLKWHSIFNDRQSMTVSMGYDSYHYGLEDTFNEYTAYTLNTDVNQAFAKVNFKSSVGEKHTLGYGLDVVAYDLNPGEYHPVGDRSLVVARDLTRERAIEAALYLSDTWMISNRFSVDAGLRWSQFLRQGLTRFYGGPEVRLSGKYSFNDQTSIKAGFNTMRQYIHMISNSINVSPTDSWRLSSDKIRPQVGWQAAMGFYRTLMDNTVDLSVEAYYKRVKHYVDYRSGAVLVMNENLADELVETENRAYGVEFMAKKTLGKLNGWVSYTYSRSQLREMYDRGVETINGGDWYNAAYDKPHDVKVVANYKFTHRYSISANLDYSTGRPVTIPVGRYNYDGGVRLVYSERNGYRIPDYFRLDLAFIVEPGHYLKQFTHMSLTFGCYNVTGRKNAYSIYYTTDGATVQGHMMSVFATQIPYINLNLKF
ncbi:MAG: TonB-dependent receptor [Bacteroidales bacterium]|nr:TonB-dependent receptor [Bacteroidales bacterium]